MITICIKKLSGHEIKVVQDQDIFLSMVKTLRKLELEVVRDAKTGSGVPKKVRGY